MSDAPHTSAPPAAPLSLEDTGIDVNDLLALFTKTLLGGSIDTVPKVADAMKLPQRVAQQLYEIATERMLVESLGQGQLGIQQQRFVLTLRGRDWAHQALETNGYIGPAPVTLNDYVARIRLQSISDERISPETLLRCMRGLVMPAEMPDQIGPALNSGRPILLYGPPGNGKTSLAYRIGSVYASTVYVPYAFEAGGQIIKVFDPDVHKEVQVPPEPGVNRISIRTSNVDARWVPCARPFVVTGGELTLEMLDLQYNHALKIYEAPLHLKASNGVFVIDDFGRQLVQPETLLNRWIVPLENKVDYLKLHTGKSFQIPFDELVVFSTNLPPSRLMDPAFLRRLPFKIEVGPPTPDAFRQIFHAIAKEKGITTSDEVVDFILEELTVRNDFQLGGYQPRFLVDQLVSVSRYRGTLPRFEPQILRIAIGNLFTKDHEGYRTESAV